MTLSSMRVKWYYKNIIVKPRCYQMASQFSKLKLDRKLMVYIITESLAAPTKNTSNFYTVLPGVGKHIIRYPHKAHTINFY